MPDFYLTFGTNHTPGRHPNLDVADPDGWVTITAPDYLTARAVAVYLAGSAWSMLYTDPTDVLATYGGEPIFPRGQLAAYTAKSTIREFPAGDVVLTAEILDIDLGMPAQIATPKPCNCHLAPVLASGDAMVHHVKSWPPHYQDTAVDAKRIDIRTNDRDYQPGDILHLREYDPTPTPIDDPCTIIGYTGRCCIRRITHVLPGGQFGLDPTAAALSLRVVYGDDRPR
jgi:hypothetical protein